MILPAVSYWPLEQAAPGIVPVGQGKRIQEPFLGNEHNNGIEKVLIDGSN